jgi:hypothetical protein
MFAGAAGEHARPPHPQPQRGPAKAICRRLGAVAGGQAAALRLPDREGGFFVLPAAGAAVATGEP